MIQHQAGGFLLELSRKKNVVFWSSDTSLKMAILPPTLVSRIIEPLQVANKSDTIRRTYGPSLLSPLAMMRRIAIRGPDAPAHTPSEKGFIAIDLDGTALVEKLDKNFRYGVKHPDSNLRVNLFHYLKSAQEKGYDIVILTARPSIVEPLLALPIGSMPTARIRKAFADQGINISRVYRKVGGRKGTKMQQILKTYPSGAKGLLIDDQTKQTVSAHRIGDEHLRGFDINSLREMTDFLNWIGEWSHKPIDKTDDTGKTYQMWIDQHTGHNAGRYNPESIAADMIDIITKYVKDPENSSLTREQKETATALHHLIEKASKYTEQKEKLNLINSLIKELSFRLREVWDCGYLPEIKWVGTCANYVRKFLEDNNASDASKAIFGKSNIHTVVPNTECQKIVKELLLRDDLQLQPPNVSNPTIINVSKLPEKLNEKDTNPKWDKTIDNDNQAGAAEHKKNPLHEEELRNNDLDKNDWNEGKSYKLYKLLGSFVMWRKNTNLEEFNSFQEIKNLCASLDSLIKENPKKLGNDGVIDKLKNDNMYTINKILSLDLKKDKIDSLDIDGIKPLRSTLERLTKYRVSPGPINLERETK